jgi:hypothetical protein
LAEKDDCLIYTYQLMFREFKKYIKPRKNNLLLLLLQKNGTRGKVQNENT